MKYQFGQICICALLLCLAKPLLANTTDALFVEATGVLSLPSLKVNNEFYSIDLKLIDVSKLWFKVDLSTARFKGVNDGSYFNASILTNSTTLSIARLAIGNQIFSASLNLVDASQLIFQLDLSSVRNIGTKNNNSESVLNAFSYLQDSSAGLPLINNYFTVTFPANPSIGTPQTSVNVPLKFGQLTVTPLINTNSLVLVHGMASTVALNSSQINCYFTFDLVVDLASGANSSIRLSSVSGPNTASWGNHSNWTCNTAVAGPAGATWYLGISTPPSGDFTTASTIVPTGDTSGTVTQTLSGTGTVTAILSNGSTFQNSSQFLSGSNLPLTINTSMNMTVQADGSVYSNGVLVKNATTSGGSSGGSGSGSCVNEFRVVSPFQSFYSGNAVTIPFTATGTGTISNMDGGRVILLTSTAKIETVPRFRLQLMIPYNKLAVGTVKILDDQNSLGFDPSGGAIARLIYSIGSSNGTEVNDSFWSNKDWGSQRTRTGQDSGTIVITSMSPKITGTFTGLQLSGDGYPSLTNYFASVVDGKFCVSP